MKIKGLKKFLDKGNTVIGAGIDKKLVPLKSMSLAMKRRHGYVKKNSEDFTERGWARFTREDD